MLSTVAPPPLHRDCREAKAMLQGTNYVDEESESEHEDDNSASDSLQISSGSDSLKCQVMRVIMKMKEI